MGNIFASSSCRNLVLWIGPALREKFQISSYFEDIWNFFDLVSLILLVCWVGLAFSDSRTNQSVDFTIPYSNYTNDYNYPTTAPTSMDTKTLNRHSFDNSPFTNGRIILSFAALPLVFGLLQFSLLYKPLGELVIMILEMIRNDFAYFSFVWLVITLGLV